MDKKIYLNYGMVGILTVIFYCASSLKISFAASSSSFTLSVLQILIPLSGYFLGISMAGGAFLSYVIVKSSLLGMPLFPFFTTLGLPTFCSTFYLSDGHRKLFIKERFQHWAEVAVRIILPVSAIVLFTLHPCGRGAVYYTFFWLIPPFLYLLEKMSRHVRETFFVHALTASFLAHMAGSLIYLYSFAFPASYWLSLIPVVFVERCILAAGMTAFYLLIERSKSILLYKKQLDSFVLTK
jgi:hypothetical protein